MTTDSEIIIHKGGTTYAGPDAVNLLRARMLAGYIELWIKTKLIPARGVTITRMLDTAKQYTAKTYKRGEAAQAAADVRKWADAMQAALPITDERKEG